jgi:hypothetical protein
VTASPICTVLIVTWNSARFIGSCLDALATSTRQPITTIVVDSASSDGTAESVRQHYPSVHLIEPGHNLGFVAGNNLALRQVTTPYALLLNPDCELRPGALDTLLAFMQAHPRAATVAPQLRNTDGSLQYSTFVHPTVATVAWEYFLRDNAHPNHVKAGRYTASDYDQERQVGGVLGACFLVRTAALNSVGLLDPRFFMYCEEVDWQMRAQRAGWQVWYTPTAVATHHGGQSTKLAAESTFLELQRSRFKLYAKWYPPAERVALAAVTKAGILYQLGFWTKQLLRHRLTTSQWRGRLVLTLCVLGLRPSGERW